MNLYWTVVPGASWTVTPQSGLLCLYGVRSSARAFLGSHLPRAAMFPTLLNGSFISLSIHSEETSAAKQKPGLVITHILIVSPKTVLVTGTSCLKVMSAAANEQTAPEPSRFTTRRNVGAGQADVSVSAPADMLAGVSVVLAGVSVVLAGVLAVVLSGVSVSQPSSSVSVSVLVAELVAALVDVLVTVLACVLVVVLSVMLLDVLLDTLSDVLSGMLVVVPLAEQADVTISPLVDALAAVLEVVLSDALSGVLVVVPLAEQADVTISPLGDALAGVLEAVLLDVLSEMLSDVLSGVLVVVPLAEQADVTISPLVDALAAVLAGVLAVVLSAVLLAVLTTAVLSSVLAGVLSRVLAGMLVAVPLAEQADVTESTLVDVTGSTLAEVPGVALVIVPTVVPGVGLGVPPVRSGQIPLPVRRSLGYSTLERPFLRVTVTPPLPSAVKAVQLITSMSAWLAVKPVADEPRVTVFDDEDPLLVYTPTTW